MHEPAAGRCAQQRRHSFAHQCSQCIGGRCRLGGRSGEEWTGDERRVEERRGGKTRAEQRRERRGAEQSRGEAERQPDSIVVDLRSPVVCRNPRDASGIVLLEQGRPSPSRLLRHHRSCGGWFRNFRPQRTGTTGPMSVLLRVPQTPPWRRVEELISNRNALTPPGLRNDP